MQTIQRVNDVLAKAAFRVFLMCCICSTRRELGIASRHTNELSIQAIRKSPNSLSCAPSSQKYAIPIGILKLTMVGDAFLS